MANVYFSNARAKSLSQTLLGTDRLYRMIDCQNPDEAIKMLTEVGFGDGLNSSALEFEKLISVEKQNLFKFVRENSPDENFTKFLLLKNDFHNAEALIKKKYLKIDLQEIREADGTLAFEYLEDKIMSDDYRELPSELKTALLQCDNDFVNNVATGSSVSNIFEKAYFNQLYLLAKGDRYLDELYKTKCDVANISIALRTRNFVLAKDNFVRLGRLSLNDLKALCEEPLNVLKEKFKYSKAQELISFAVDAKEKGAPLSLFEKSADGYAVNFLDKSKYESDGMFPFMQYCFYKLADLFNVRIVMIGLLNDLPKTEIKGRLRACYER